ARTKCLAIDDPIAIRIPLEIGDHDIVVGRRRRSERSEDQQQQRCDSMFRCHDVMILDGGFSKAKTATDSGLERSIEKSTSVPRRQCPGAPASLPAVRLSFPAQRTAPTTIAAPSSRKKSRRWWPAEGV